MHVFWWAICGAEFDRTATRLVAHFFLLKTHPRRHQIALYPVALSGQQDTLPARRTDSL